MAGVEFLQDRGHPLTKVQNDVLRAVRRGVVDHYQFDVRVSLGERAANAARQEPAVVVVVYNDGDKRRSHIKILKYKDIFDVGSPQRAEFPAISLRAGNLLLAPLRR